VPRSLVVREEEREWKALSPRLKQLMVNLLLWGWAQGVGVTTAASNFVRALCDAKSLACGVAYTFLIAAHSNDQDASPVEKRAAKLPKE